MRIAGPTRLVRQEVAAGPSGPPPPAVSAAPLAFWRMEEATSPRADSGTGLGSPLSALTTDPGNLAGKVGSAVPMNGTSAVLRTTTNAAQFNPGAGVSFTFAAWVSLTSLTGFGYVAANANAGVTAGWGIGWTGSHYAFITGNGALRELDDNAGASPGTGVWCFLCARYDASNKTMYLRTNANADATMVLGADPTAGPGELRFSQATAGGNPLLCVIDAVGWWRVKLSDADVTALYAGGVGTEFYSGSWH